MTIAIPIRPELAAASRVRTALGDDFDSHRNLPPFLEFASSRPNYAPCVAELLKIFFPYQWAGKLQIVKELIDPYLAPELRLVRIAGIFRLIPLGKFGRPSCFSFSELAAATNVKPKSARAWAAFACLGFVRGADGTPVEFNFENAPWPKVRKERAALLLWLVTRRAYELRSERRL